VTRSALRASSSIAIRSKPRNILDLSIARAGAHDYPTPNSTKRRFRLLPYTARWSRTKALQVYAAAGRLQASGSGYALEHETIEGTAKERP
jgi:hypothetical protein